MQSNKQTQPMKPMPGDNKNIQPVGDSHTGVTREMGELPSSPANAPGPQTNVQAAKHTGEDGTKKVAAEKEPKTKKVVLRVKMKHPNGRFQIGRHSLSTMFQTFELNEAEQKELETAGPKAWVEVGDEKKMKADTDLRAKMNPKNLDKEAL